MKIHYIQVFMKDITVALLILLAATGIGAAFWDLGFTEANIITVYILGVLLTSLFAQSHICYVISSLMSVLLFNFFFTKPRLTFHAYEQGYPVTFAIMLIAALITGTLAEKLKEHARQSAQTALRAKMLLDTNRLLQKEKEQAAILAHQEQLRANLLRAISHDLRTPLTSISGNASNLMSNYLQLDDETRLQMFTDIYDDAQWLIELVENLLSVSRIEDGKLNFNMTTELIDEVVEEALKHINRKKTEHNISVEYRDELLLAKMDAKLILQVIINIVDNAIKYTPVGSSIVISVGRKENMACISIADNGSGIPDEMKPKVFQMFFTGENKIVDNRRSLGIGLALCNSIIHAHGGTLSVTDNIPHGCIFVFTLPLGQVEVSRFEGQGYEREEVDIDEQNSSSGGGR